MFFLMLSFFLYLCFFIFFFSKKLLCLLYMEGMMILCIIIYSLNVSHSFCAMSILFTISIFMVLDSILGVTILISDSRNKSFSLKHF